MKNLPGNKHVGLFFSNFKGGGIQKLMLVLAQELVHQGWTVDIITVSGFGPVNSKPISECNYIDLNSLHARNSIFKLIRYLKLSNPNVFLSSQTHLNVVSVISKFLSGWRGKLLVSEHTNIDLVVENPGNWKDKFLPLFARFFYRYVNKVIIVSKGAKEIFIKATGLPHNLVEVIYNPVVSKDLMLKSHCSSEHAWIEDRTCEVIVGSGRLTEQKDFKTLINAFEIVRRQISNAKLIILGEGEERKNLKHQINSLGLENSVDLPGFIANPYPFFAKASVFVLSSKWEGLGNVLIEAMALGTPVVSTNCPSGPSEILENGKLGFLTPPEDPELLAEAIIETFKNPVSEELIIARAQDFSIKKIVPQYIKIFLSSSRGNK